MSLSDIDRGVYETLDLRLARHPSETVRYMLTRLLAYALSYEEGIAFSKGGLSDPDEPPVSVRDATGVLTAWIDVGLPSAERLHKASKAARRVALFTSGDVELVRKDAASRPIYRGEHIAVWRLEASFLEALEATLTRSTALELVRTEGQLYVSVAGRTLEGRVSNEPLIAAP